MIINGTIFNCDLTEVLLRLQEELRQENILLLQKIKDVGQDIQVQCPYHGNGQERRPSAGIRKVDGKFHCFACGEVHELPEVISFCFGWTEDILGVRGLKWLIRRFSAVEVEERQDIELDYDRLQRTTKPQNYVLEEELDNYRYYHPYWQKRGIYDERIIELFDLGYDKQTDSITFPVRDTDGNCLFVARRAVSRKAFNYPKGVEKPLYGLYELTKIPKTPDELFVCESMIDCILLWQAGFYAVALNGVGSSRQYEELRRIHIRKIILATDGDPAGQKARKELRKQVPNKIFTEIQFPSGIKDIGECTEEEVLNIKDWEVF